MYNIRYQLNKARGLGSIGALPKPTDGIGAPPKRTRRVKAGELASLPEPYGFGSAPIKAEGQPVAYMPITMIEPKPTLWERIKGWFRA